MNINSGDTIPFNIKKNFEFVKSLGAGGTGLVYLLNDKTTDMLFAFKKYVSSDAQYTDEYYKRFVDEIKILFNLSHQNIVRVYNYYLYPEQKTGYLQMEYVIGTTIDKFDPMPWEEEIWNSIFSETVTAFDYIEKNGILHRDVRPSNILIDKNNHVKIIDFGFGKKYSSTNKEPNSIILNWPVSEMPEEIQTNGEYNHKTEIFFVGKLFEKIIKKRNISDDFIFSHVIEKMTQIDTDNRYNSFADVLGDISKGILGGIEFTLNEKEIYRKFSDCLLGKINHFTGIYTPINEISLIMNNLSELTKKSALEKYIQDNSQLIGCFVKVGYNYSTKKDIEVDLVFNFYKLMFGLPPAKQRVLYDNLCNRLTTVTVEQEDDYDNLPF